RVHDGGGGGELAPGAGELRLALGLERPGGGDAMEERAIRRRVHEAGEERVEVGPRGLDCAPRPRTEASSFEDIISITRQSAHMRSRARASGRVNIECPPSLPTMASIICFVPKGLSHRTH